MAVPVVVGSAGFHNLDTNTTGTINISSIATGSWMVVSVMTSITAITITAPSGWVAINSGQTTGTRRNFLFAKLKTGADGSSAVFTQSAAVAVGYGIVWGTGGVDPTYWISGTTWTRNGNSVQATGSRTDIVAPSITTVDIDHLVLAISNEATTALVQSMEVSNVSPVGWTQQLALTQGTTSQIETIWIGSKPLVAAGASGNVTLTYTSPQDNNGWGMQIGIPSKPPVALPVPSVVGSQTTISDVSGTAFTISRPGGALTGDYIIVVVRSQATDATAEPASAGFTRLGPAFETVSSPARMNGIYGRPISNISTEPTSYTFSFATGSVRVVAVAFVVRGVDLADPVIGFANSYASTAITGGRRVEQYALSVVPGLQLFMGGAEFSSPNDHVPVTTPIGYTPIVSLPSSTLLSGSRTYLWVGSLVVHAGPTQTASITWGTPVGSAAESIVLRGTDALPVDPAGLGVVAALGNGSEARVYYKTASGFQTPNALVPMRRGFANTTDLLNTYGSTWAHRGGSSSYPEMSLYGYTQSVARGYGALEVSLARTSDGVWFGLHDQTTDRTSGGVFGNASSQTWAQIQAQSITIGSQKAPQPYMRWEEIVATYGSTHIIIADPKYALGGFRTEFLNMVANDIGPSRAIIKYSGVGSGATALSTAAQAMGFQTWGFFYAADASLAQGGSGSLQTWGSFWTTLGMEYGASQAVWDEVLAFGKPVIGHIAPNQAAYNAAMSKGATGVQVSGVGVVEPVSWWNALPKAQNLIGAYGFNEGSGTTLIDSSFKSHPLTLGTFTNWNNGHYGTGLQSTNITGTGAVNTSFNNPTTAITLMGWVYPRTVTSEIPLFGFWSSPSSDPTGTNQFAIYASRSSFGPSNVLAVGANINSTQVAVTGTQATINAWQHVAATYDGTTVKLYLNGSLVSSTVQAGALGVGSFVSTAKTDSIADDVRVFNTPLTQAEIVKWMKRSI